MPKTSYMPSTPLSLTAAVYLLVTGAGPVVVNANECGWLAGCYLNNFDQDQLRVLDVEAVNVYSFGDDNDSLSVRCDVVAPPGSTNGTTGVDWIEFQYGNGETHKDFAEPYWMSGNLPAYTNRVKYLRTNCPERKSVRVAGRVWGEKEACFEETFELFAQCDGFDITLSLGDSVEDPAPFTEAAERWREVISGDIPPVIGFGDFVEPFEDCTFPMDVDDLEICGMLEPMDDPSILAFAGPDYLRADSHLPINGLMVINSNLKSSTDLLRKTILREMGHVLGVGTLWEMTGVAGSDTESCPYNGSRAVQEFEKISGCDTGLVPVELGGGAGSRCSHWAESCFGDELMTPQSSSKWVLHMPAISSSRCGFSALADVGDAEPLSQITAASLEDLGYEVSFDLVDQITASDLASSCRCDVQSSRRRRLAGWRQVSTDRPRRKLRKESEELAKTAAREFLRRREVDKSAIPESVRFVGDQVVIVYVEQEGAVYDVVVTK